MGVLDTVAKKFSDRLKSNGAVITDLVPMAQALATQMGLTPISAGSLPRDTNLGNPFGAGYPLTPFFINPANAEGQPDPRRNEFLISQNINTQPTRIIPFLFFVPPLSKWT